MNNTFTSTRNVICLLLLLQNLNGHAQSYHNLLSSGYYFSSPTYTPDKAKISVFYFRASIPLKLKNGNYFLLNPDLHQQSFVFSDQKQLTCYKTGLASAYMKITKKGSIVTVLNLSNNFEKGQIDARSMQFGGGVLVTRKYNDRFKLKFGLYANREFFSPLFVPLLGLDYKIKPNVRLFGILPQSMRLEFKHKQSFRSGFSFETPLNTYALGGSNKQYLDQRQILGGIYEDIYISKNVVLQLGVKFPIFNSQKIFSKDQTYLMSIAGVGMGGERMQTPTEKAFLKHGVIMELSLNYRLEIDK